MQRLVDFAAELEISYQEWRIRVVIFYVLQNSGTGIVCITITAKMCARVVNSYVAAKKTIAFLSVLPSFRKVHTIAHRTFVNDFCHAAGNIHADL